MGVRGSICASVFIVVAGAPRGVRLLWAKAESCRLRVESARSVVGVIFWVFS
jgi:hypothetical protein